jgi:hypothetical protein
MSLRRSCAYKVHAPPPFRESISWIISPFKFWTATIFLHAHLQVVYYKCVKFHKNPISRLGGVALTRYMDGRTDGRTDGKGDSYIPPNFVCGGYKKKCSSQSSLIDTLVRAKLKSVSERRKSDDRTDKRTNGQQKS